ncbi:hypothetical protein CN984_08700 [Bacillus cereus]|uniref:Uncharacterized protein n=1 Tax=Bacillus cereus TaxID=1396 RepID=A0A2B9QB10_BACCE|nr:hypothetical protein CN984_08700 [Bacillus cereus]
MHLRIGMTRNTMFLERWTVAATEKSECWLITMECLKRTIMQAHGIGRDTGITKGVIASLETAYL